MIPNLPLRCKSELSSLRRVWVTSILLLLVATSSGCSGEVDELLGGDRLEAPAGLVVESTVEIVQEDDPRVEALGPPPVFEIMNQSGGFTQYVLLRPSHCGQVPGLRLSAVGERLNIEILEVDEGRLCGDREVVFMELQLSQEFRVIALGRPDS